MRGAASPHDFSLRPSDARRIQQAHVVFLVAESLETSLAGPIDALAADAHGHEDDDHGSFDLHVWLDPHDAAAMTRAIAATLSSADPENMDAYGANAAAFAARLDALTQRIATQTASVRGQPFIVFHDAYRHFEDRFGFTAAARP